MRAGYRVAPGRPLPLGVTDCCDGFNFAVFSRHAERVELLLFEDAVDAEPMLVIDLDRRYHRTGDIWHVLVDGLRWGQAYQYRVHGPWVPEQGHRFDGTSPLLDPYALAIHSPVASGREDPHASPHSQSRTGNHRCLLVDRQFDWQGTCRPKTPWSDTVIYETHVRGFTIDLSVRAAHPGTFLGVIEKVPYLRKLGITAVELMPIQEFDAGSNPRSDPATGNRRGRPRRCQ